MYKPLVEKDLEKVSGLFYLYRKIYFVIGIVFFLGYLSIADELIIFFIGKEVIMERSIIIILTLNYFIQYIKQVTIVFRDSTGSFYRDSYKAVLEGLINIGLSLIFVNFIGINGVLLATIITNLFTSDLIEPYILYKYIFDKRIYKFYITNYSIIIMFYILMLIHEQIPKFGSSLFTKILYNGFLSVIISFLTFAILYLLQAILSSELFEI